MRSQIGSIAPSATPASRKAFFHTGRCSRLTIEASSSWPEVTPRITLARLRSIAANWPRVASSSTCSATMSPSSCELSVAEAMLGGMP